MASGYDKPKQCVGKQRHYSADKGPYSQGYGLSSSHVWVWELDFKAGRAPENWCLQTVVLKKTPESPLDNTKLKLVNFKGSQPWILVWRTDAEAEIPVFWSLDVDSQLTEKVRDAGEDWEQKEKKASKDEMAKWHHWCNAHELGQTWGDGEGQRGLVCCSPWAHKESNTPGWLNNNNPVFLTLLIEDTIFCPLNIHGYFAMN